MSVGNFKPVLSKPHTSQQITIEMLMSAKYAKVLLCGLTKFIIIFKYEYMDSEFVIFEIQSNQKIIHIYIFDIFFVNQGFEQYEFANKTLSVNLGMRLIRCINIVSEICGYN